jgi:hypothetical protein
MFERSMYNNQMLDVWRKDNFVEFLVALIPEDLEKESGEYFFRRLLNADADFMADLKQDWKRAAALARMVLAACSSVSSSLRENVGPPSSLYGQSVDIDVDKPISEEIDSNVNDIVSLTQTSHTLIFVHHSDQQYLWEGEGG